MPPIFLLAVKIAFLVILYLFVARAVRAVVSSGSSSGSTKDGNAAGTSRAAPVYEVRCSSLTNTSPVAPSSSAWSSRRCTSNRISSGARCGTVRQSTCSRISPGTTFAEIWSVNTSVGANVSGPRTESSTTSSSRSRDSRLASE